MNEISILDKLQVLFNITKSNIFYPIIIFLLVITSFLFMTTNKNNIKESKKTYSIIYFITIIIVIIRYGSSIKTMFDYMMNNLFIVLYFPNIAVYLGAIIITNIIMWVSMFSTSTKQIIKTINSIVFSIIHYLFILILSIISTENINVFNQQELYQNNNIHSLIELSSNVFIIWILFMIIYKIVVTYIDSKKVKDNYNNIILEGVRSKSEDKSVLLTLPDNTIKIKHPYIVKREMSNRMVYEIPKQQENTMIYDNSFTLDDYKLLVSLLNEQKNNGMNTILQNKKIKEDPIINNKNINNKESNISELMALYKKTI